MPPTISIIIVNWNTAQFLQNCLVSIYQETHLDNLEVIVVDNASLDDSVAKVRLNFPWVKLFCNTENVGLAKAYNFAIKQAQGRYIVLLNSDTLLLSSFQAISDWLDHQPNIGMVGGKVLNPDHTIQETCVRQFPTIASKITNYLRIGSRFFRAIIPYLENKPGFDYSQSQSVPIVSGALMLIPQEVLAKVSLLNESFFLYGEDLDLAKRIHNAGYQIWYSPLITIVHFGSQSSLQIAEKTHFMRLQGIAKYFDLHRGKQYGNLYRYWLWIFALMGYLPITLLWFVSPIPEHKARLKEFLAVFGHILKDPFLVKNQKI